MRRMLLLLLIAVSSDVSAQLKVDIVLCENKPHPLGVSCKSLHFGWEISSPKNSAKQSAFELVISSSEKNSEHGIYDVWNSSVVNSKQSVLVAYRGKILRSATQYYWKVKVWDQFGKPSKWSKLSSFCTGLENKSDWNQARWIGYEDLADSLRLAPGADDSNADKIKNNPLKRPVTPLIRKEFKITKTVKSAYAFISGLGQYELLINGKKASNGFLTPGWTYYDKSCLYNVLDITSLLKNGNNCIGAILGNGFFNINRERYSKLVDAFGMPKMICRVLIRYNDGTECDLCSDASWKVSPSAILFNSIYGGEDYDANLEQGHWAEPGFDDRHWKNTELVKAPAGHLLADMDYPVAVMDTFQVKKITEPAPGIFVYDFGQNSSGIVALKIRGHKGQKVKLIPAEILNQEKLANQNATGNPYYFSYIIKSDSTETWVPQFTYYGFRYVQVEGARPDTSVSNYLPVILQLTALHTRNAGPSNGSFECSNELFNRIFTLINWAIKSNLQSVVTDCPHREKLGWLEQDYLMGTSIHYNFDNYSLYRKLVFDLMDAQQANGLVPDIAPEYVQFDGGFRDSPEWGSSAVILPWLLYQWNGDRDIVEKAFPMIKKYVAYLESKSNHHILDYGLGDWYDYGPAAPGYAQLTPRALTATAIYYDDVVLAGKMAAVLKRYRDEKAFDDLAGQIKLAFNNRFFDAATNTYSTGSQTAMAMPLSVGLVNGKNRSVVLQNLVDSIKTHHYALTAGDIGFHFLVDALDKGERGQIIYDMNNRDNVPGYGYQLKKGATSLTESWAALEEVSNNHLMLGHIMEWFYSGLAGISQESGSVGFQTLKIKPQPVGDINYAKGSFHTPYGWVKTSWTKNKGSFRLKVEIPANSNANIYLPAHRYSKIYENNKLVRKMGSYENGRAMLSVASGIYQFEVK